MSLARVVVFTVASGALCAAPAAGQTVVDPGLKLELVASGLSSPTSMAFIGPGDILVLHKWDGQVRRVLNGVLLPAPVLDVAVETFSERGLLGIAVDPDFVINPFVFLFYTESSTGTDTNGEAPPLGNRVYRYTWNGTALVNPFLVLDLPAGPSPNHQEIGRAHV